MYHLLSTMDHVQKHKNNNYDIEKYADDIQNIIQDFEVKFQDFEKTRENL